MRSKWSRRIRWFLDLFTIGYTMYSKSGFEIRIHGNGGFTVPHSELPRIMDKHLADRARLEARWRAEQEAAKTQGGNSQP